MWTRDRLPALVLALLAAGASLGGCRTRGEVAVEVAPDGSGRFAVALGLDAAAWRSAEQLGDSPREALSEALGAGPGGRADGTVSEAWAEDGFRGRRLSFELRSLAELEGALAAAFPVPEGGAASRPVVRREGDVLEIEVHPGPAVSAVVESVLREARAMSRAAGTSDPGGLTAERLASLADLRLAVAVPGPVLEHNADAVEERRLVWSLLPAPDEPVHLRARMEPAEEQPVGRRAPGGERPASDRSRRVPLVAVAALAALAALVVLAVRARLSRRFPG